MVFVPFPRKLQLKLGGILLVSFFYCVQQTNQIAYSKIDSEKEFLNPGYWTTELETFDGRKITKDLLVDIKAKSADPGEPPFLAPPEGSKVYHGHPLIMETCLEGYCYGAISDFLQDDSGSGCTIGDGFVQAADGSRAGVFWEVGEERRYRMIEKPGDERWGVYYFTVPSPIRTMDDLKKMFEEMLPVLKELHERHKK